ETGRRRMPRMASRRSFNSIDPLLADDTRRVLDELVTDSALLTYRLDLHDDGRALSLEEERVFDDEASVHHRDRLLRRGPRRRAARRSHRAARGRRRRMAAGQRQFDLDRLVGADVEGLASGVSAAAAGRAGAAQAEAVAAC